MIQFADPNTEVDGERAKMNTVNPTMGDKAVRQALNLAVQRDVISQQLYAGEEFEPPTANILTGIPSMESPNTSWEFNVEEAKQILEEAGWTMQGDVRAKDGVELSITYVTSINPVRQKEQAIIKQALEQIGFRTELRQVDAAVFFDSSPGNDQNINHFYNDLEMYTDNPTTPFPVAYMIGWYGGPDGENIAQAVERLDRPELPALPERRVRQALRAGAAGDRPREGGGAVHPDERHPDQRGRGGPAGQPRGRQVRHLDDAAGGERRRRAPSSTTTGTSPTGTGRRRDSPHPTPNALIPVALGEGLQAAARTGSLLSVSEERGAFWSRRG